MIDYPSQFAYLINKSWSFLYFKFTKIFAAKITFIFFYYRHIRSPWIGIDGKIRGEAAIRSMPTSKISNLLRSIDRLREGRVNIRDLDRRDINSINKLLESYGVHQWIINAITFFENPTYQYYITRLLIIIEVAQKNCYAH